MIVKIEILVYFFKLFVSVDVECFMNKSFRSKITYGNIHYTLNALVYTFRFSNYSFIQFFFNDSPISLKRFDILE